MCEATATDGWKGGGIDEKLTFASLLAYTIFLFINAPLASITYLLLFMGVRVRTRESYNSNSVVFQCIVVNWGGGGG